MALKEYFEFSSPTKMMFGEEIAGEVGTEVEALGSNRGLLVTDRGIVEAGLTEAVEKSLNDSSMDLVGIFQEVPVNSEIEVCQKIAEIGKENDVDTLITIGGGSVIDTGKGANVLLSVGGDLLEDWQGTHLVPEPLKNHVAIPTTAGTGAEVSVGAVIKHTPDNQKISFVSKYLAPDVAILDPTLTLTLPPGLTASTGVDALTHAVESFTSQEHSPPSDALSYYVVQTVFKHLPRAYSQGQNLEARGYMLIAASLAGIALSTTQSIGACHAMAHAAGGLSPVPHGVANAIILPVVAKFNLESCVDRYAELAPAMGIDVSGLDRGEAALRAVETLGQFIQQFDMPKTLKEAGADSSLAERMAEEAMGDGQMYANPREAEYEEILELFTGLLQ